MPFYKENKLRRSERLHYRSLIYITIALIVGISILSIIHSWNIFIKDN